MPSSHEPPSGGKIPIRPPLRLVHPAPVQPPPRRTRGGHKRAHHLDVFSPEEQARLLAALRNARFLLGTWRCLADAMRVPLKGLEHVYRGRSPVSAAIAVRLARALGVSVESLYRAPTDAKRCPHCGRGPT